MPQPLPLVTPLPGALASAIHYASTFHRASLVWLDAVLPGTSTFISLQLRMVPWPPPFVDPSLVTAFGIVCCHSCQPIRPVQRHLPPSERHPNIAVSVSLRCVSVASIGLPLLMPLPWVPLRAFVASARSPTLLLLPRAPVARFWPQGGSKSEWMMIVFGEHCGSWSQKPIVLARTEQLRKIGNVIFLPRPF